jgi:hypothetical protein
MAFTPFMFLGLLIARGPLAIAALIGIIVALSLRARSGKAALLMAGACALVRCEQIVGIPAAILPQLLRSFHLSLSLIAVFAVILDLVSAVLMTVAVILFIAAAFVGRAPAAGTTPQWQQQAPQYPYQPPQPPPNPYQR